VNVLGLQAEPRRRRRTTSRRHLALGRPQVVAHRGSSSNHAEHTLDAYVTALEEGADALECDVRLTADGHLVCVHDRRIDRTSNGQGPVSVLELSQLEGLDWTSWKDAAATRRAGTAGATPEPTPPDGDGSRILTLERLLEVVSDWTRPVELAIETKHPTRYAGLVERKLVETLDRHRWAHPRPRRTSPVRVMSFSWMSLRRCLELAPGLETVYLMERVPLRFRDGSLPFGAHVAGPSIDIVLAHPEYVAKVQRAGNEVHVWTVNTAVEVDTCAALGVDAVITDRPREVRSLLTSASSTGLF
jgi:glycerophosphoryl diester phosphodiesterase